MGVLVVVNAFVCQYLFFANFIQQLCSVEGPFIALIRYPMRHSGDLKWFPLWFSGMPFLQVYQPGLFLTIASAARLFGSSPERAYHYVTALLYCLGPIAFYLLCYRATHSSAAAFVAGMLYSLVSPAAFLSSAIRNDLGGRLLARRYQTLVHYGEAPHIAALTLIPLAIVCLDAAAGSPRSLKRIWAIPASILLLAAIAVTNWTGTIGLAMAVIAYLLACLGAGEGRLQWPSFLAIAVLAYMIACPWIPPSIVSSIPGNAQNSDGTTFQGRHIAWLLGTAAALAVIHVAFQRALISKWVRFFCYFSLLSGGVVLGFYWFDLKLLPQPHRWQMELEMALIGAAVCVARKPWGRWPTHLRTLAVTALIVLFVVQIGNYHRYAFDQTLPQDMSKTVEYEMARWFEAKMPGERVFAPGSVGLWLNALTEVPQIVGCCDQSVPSLEHRIAFYSVYVGDKANSRDGEMAVLWLKAYGAQAIGVSGTHAREFFKAFVNPDKFRGVLPEIWRDGDDIVYRVPSRSASLAHVVPADHIVSRAPVNGVDVQPLIAYVQALEDPHLPLADFRWMNGHSARIQALLQPGQLISVQASYSPNWRARSNGHVATVLRDALGLTVVDPHCNGNCIVDLIYDDSAEARWTQLASWCGVLACLAWMIREYRKLAAG